jgi:hypothetical protein
MGPERSNLMKGDLNEVAKAGDTVVRAGGPHTPVVHAVLRYVRDRGFVGAPEVVAWDPTTSTETLTFLPGEVGDYPLPDSFRTDRALVSAARLLRELHDASVGFEHGEYGDWFLPPRLPVEVICHGDFAPYNCVVIDGEVTGVFDFDTAHPAPRIWDVGYAAYRWVPLTAPQNHDGFGNVVEQARRLRLFCSAYGISDRDHGLVVAQERLAFLVETIESRAAAGDVQFQQHVRDGHVDLYRRDISYIAENNRQLADT